MTLPLDELDLLNAPDSLASGMPLRLPLDTIEEDPEQPRLEFDDHSLCELALTIRERGVRQPVSVRRHPTAVGRWMLNFGARRLRACRMAGLAEIPAFVDNAVDNYDQVIENEQREGLKPLELAMFVRKRLALGETQADIARRLGKSPTLITMVCAMIDPPEWLMAAYRSGQCRGIKELYELRRVGEERPAEVMSLISAGKPITRQVVATIKMLPQAASVGSPSTLSLSQPDRRASATTNSTSHDAPSHEPDAAPRAKPLSDRLLREAAEHCAALASIIEQLKISGDAVDCEPFSRLRENVAELATRLGHRWTA